LEELGEVSRAWPVNQFYLAPIELEEDIVSDGAAANWSVHWSTGVDKAHAAGIHGQGVRIAVIDSGIDYNHEAVSFTSGELQPHMI
jgi:subtilisin family serine protease